MVTRIRALGLADIANQKINHDQSKALDCCYFSTRLDVSENMELSVIQTTQHVECRGTLFATSCVSLISCVSPLLWLVQPTSWLVSTFPPQKELFLSSLRRQASSRIKKYSVVLNVLPLPQNEDGQAEYEPPNVRLCPNLSKIPSPILSF